MCIGKIKKIEEEKEKSGGPVRRGTDSLIGLATNQPQPHVNKGEKAKKVEATLMNFEKKQPSTNIDFFKVQKIGSHLKMVTDSKNTPKNSVSSVEKF